MYLAFEALWSAPQQTYLHSYGHFIQKVLYYESTVCGYETDLQYDIQAENYCGDIIKYIIDYYRLYFLSTSIAIDYGTYYVL